MLFKFPKRSEETENWFGSDVKFHQLYPPFIRELAGMHCTHAENCPKGCSVITPSEDVKILDIGSGVGKFCLAAAHYKPCAQIYGIEQRESLVEYANEVKNILGLSNAHFHYGNFTQLNLKLYDHFYLYNPFL